LFRRAKTAAGVGRSAIRTVVAPTDMRKRQRIAQAVCEEELRRRKDDVVFADAEDRLRIELGGQDRARVKMDGSFRRPVEPDEYSQKPTSSQVVSARLNAGDAAASNAPSEACPSVCSLAPETITCDRCGWSERIARTPAEAARTRQCAARLSRSM
jgi:hypothetical protein